MADPRAAVTDTHALMYHAGNSSVLGRKAAAAFAQCEERGFVIYVPAAVMWETALLARVSRVNLRRSVRMFFDDLFSNPAFQSLDLTPEQIFLADELRFTRDPFDALICAAAQTLNLPLITRDPVIRESGVVRTLW